MRGAAVWSSEGGTEWTVLYEDRPEFDLSPLNRVILVRGVASTSQALSALRRVGRHLQTVAVAGSDAEIPRLARELGELGATRVTSIGDAAWPATNWHHDGRFQFLDLLRFTDLEIRAD